MDQIVVRCTLCSVPLTPVLARLEDLSLLRGEDGVDFIPQGFFFNSTGELHPQGIVVNLADLVHTQRHSESRRLNGCCGLDGCDGLNRVCVEGHEVATEFSDCWMAHCVTFDPFLTTLQRATYERVSDRVDPVILAWNNTTVPRLAQAIYDGRAFDRLPILADTLEDAGCTDQDILAHCRSGGEHVRGCWVLDLLLNDAMVPVALDQCFSRYAN